MKMKKVVMVIALLAIGVGMVFFSSCKKDDTTAPVITLNGNDVMFVNFKSVFVDPGATATDDKDGAITVIVTGTVNTNLADTYTLTYYAEDDAGNSAEVTRTVHVYLKGSNMVNTYSVTDSIPGVPAYTYQDNITASGTDSTKIIVSKFAYYTNGGVYFTISGNNGKTLTIPQQTVTCGSPAADRTFSGNGTISADGNKITLNYTEVTNGTSVTGVEKYTRL